MTTSPPSSPGEDREPAPLWTSAGAGDEPPLVSVHTWTTEPKHDQVLADALGDRVVYSILAPDEADRPLPQGIGEWVTRQSAVLRSLPTGPPYRLVGWSFGGVIALEMARALATEGTEVAAVVMLDSIRPKLRYLPLGEAVLHALARAALLEDGPRRRRLLRHELGLLALRRLDVARARLSLLAERLGRPERPRPAHSTERYGPLAASITQGYVHYRGEPVTFPVSLLSTDESVASSGGDASLGWAPYLRGGYLLQRVGGDHYSLFKEERIAATADALHRALVAPGATVPGPGPSRRPQAP